MISRIAGKLTQLDDGRALVENGGVSYEILLPSGLAERLKEAGRIGDQIVFETIYYIEAGDKKASHFPRLVGFDDPIEREFFSLFTQVPGLGVKKALKSLVLPIREIATAIETKDASRLNRLPGVGGRLAEKIIAELHGKTAKYALSRKVEPLAKVDKTQEPFLEEALDVLLQLQYNRQEAERMIKRAMAERKKTRNVQELLDLIFKCQSEKSDV
ncbi:MAG TPA: helix-hairpin-helix domain-containing protein [candidate division Zixibacteria bacterium]|nr:helix-hairpin-helix domain-containing protein [candidate division Zixibacteria bacterium]